MEQNLLKWHKEICLVVGRIASVLFTRQINRGHLLDLAQMLENVAADMRRSVGT